MLSPFLGDIKTSCELILSILTINNNKINKLERELNQQAELNDIDSSQTFFDQRS